MWGGGEKSIYELVELTTPTVDTNYCVCLQSLLSLLEKGSPKG
jgi:hypothetical protein